MLYTIEASAHRTSMSTQNGPDKEAVYLELWRLEWIERLQWKVQACLGSDKSLDCYSQPAIHTEIWDVWHSRS